MARWTLMVAQLVVWLTSGALTVFVVLPWLILFWLWNLITDYSATVQSKSGKHQHMDPSRVTRWGTSRFVHLQDVTLHYVEAGDRTKPLMVCLHGFPEFWYSWRHQLKEFSTTHWVVALDLRGYGDSDKPTGRDSYQLDRLVDDVSQFIQKLGRKDCVLLAHDWGAGIGWQLVHSHPNLVNRFVPMNCPHPAAFVECISSDYTQIIKSWYVMFFQLPVVPEILLTAFGGSFFRYLFHSRSRGSKHIRPEDTRSYLDLYRHPRDLTGPINYYRNVVNDAKDPSSMYIQVPTLLLWGDEDDYLNSSMAPLSAKWVNNLTLATISGATHWVQQDAPDAVNKKIRTFIS